MKIGILGGTFDPIHIGHLSIGFSAMIQYQLDQVWFMPAGDPYFKDGSSVTAPEVRLEMTKQAVSEFNNDPMIRSCLSENQIFKTSDFEIQDRDNTYTAETLKRLKESYPEHEFFFILGMDSLRSLAKWYRPEMIVENAVILCAYRLDTEDEDGIYPTIYDLCNRERIQKDADPGVICGFHEIYADLCSKIPSCMDRIRLIFAPIIQLSSSYLRAQVKTGKSIHGLVESSTENYIQSHNLYLKHI